jgi:hypothetical protein
LETEFLKSGEAGVKKVAPLTWGGIIGNLMVSVIQPLRLSGLVAPLTWGGIIGNFKGLYVIPDFIPLRACHQLEGIDKEDTIRGNYASQRKDETR